MLGLIPRLPVGHIRSRSLAKAKTTPGAGGYALLFPSNVSGSSTSSSYGVIEFADPDDNGLPILGPSNAGVTILRRIKPVQQTGYYAQFWYTPILSGPAAPINGEAYFGVHPYPTTQSTAGTSHWWEIAMIGGDFIDYQGNAAGGGTPISVTNGQWYTQACRVDYNGGTPIVTFWVDLPTTTNGAKIIKSASLGTTNHTYKLVIGNSPWMTSYQEERASCQHGQIKIFATALSESDIVSESDSMTTLATSAGQSAIWWGKKGFASVDDLTCDYATGRSFTRNDSSNILTLGDAL